VPGNSSKCISVNYMTECKNGQYLTPSAKCSDRCPKGYYRAGVESVGRTCDSCAENCSACEDATICTECRNSMYLTPAQWCQEECPAGFYHSGSGPVGRQCLPCNDLCNLCTSADICTECKEDSFLTATSECQVVCPDGYWGKQGVQGIGGVCEECPSTCFSCTGPRECTVCKDQFYLQDGQCLPTCPEGHYHKGDTDVGRVCEQCSPKCKSCMSSDICTECQNSLYLTPESKCEADCPDGYYEKAIGTTGNTCPPCSENCSLCTNETFCTECRNGAYLTPSGTCEVSCPDGYYGEGEDLIGRVCLPCAAPCNKCLTATHCTQCRASTFLNSLTNFCDERCPTGFYHDGVAAIGRICQPCEKHCGRCESRDWCTECKNGRYLSGHACVDTCPEGHYKQGTAAIGNTCQSCSQDCRSCSSLERCKECGNSTYLTATHRCAGECSSGFVETGDEIAGRTCDPVCFWCL